MPLSLRIQGTASGVSLAVDCPDELRVLFIQELQDVFGFVKVRLRDFSTFFEGNSRPRRIDFVGFIAVVEFADCRHESCRHSGSGPN